MQRVSEPRLGTLFLGGICSSGQETEIWACPGKKDLLGWVQLKNPPELLVACRARGMKLEALGVAKTWAISLSRFLPDSEAAGEIETVKSWSKPLKSRIEFSSVLWAKETKTHQNEKLCEYHKLPARDLEGCNGRTGGSRGRQCLPKPETQANRHQLLS